MAMCTPPCGIWPTTARSSLIAHASGYNQAAPEIGAHTGIPVAITDSPSSLKVGRVADYTVSGQEGAWLAGTLAAKMSRSGTLGIVVSGEPPAGWQASLTRMGPLLLAASLMVAFRLQFGCGVVGVSGAIQWVWQSRPRFRVLGALHRQRKAAKARRGGWASPTISPC